jgi:hypothetical protein
MMIPASMPGCVVQNEKYMTPQSNTFFRIEQIEGVPAVPFNVIESVVFSPRSLFPSRWIEIIYNKSNRDRAYTLDHGSTYTTSFVV